MKDYLDSPTSVNPQKKTKDSTKLSSINIRILDDGTYTCDKNYGNYSRSETSSHKNAKELLDYLDGVIND